MFLVLSQKIDKESEYKDIPFKIYHFPKRYKNQIKKGDIFLYYQGDRHKKQNRYYFGCGIIGEITTAEEGHYNAQLIDTCKFPRSVPIYDSNNAFYESTGYSQIRTMPTPAWQNSIRKISIAAFKTVLLESGMDGDTINKLVNKSSDKKSLEEFTVLDTFLHALNEQEVEALLENPTDSDIEKLLSSLDSSGAIETRQVLQKVRKASRATTEELKNIYEHSCQLCGVNHKTPYGVDVTEAHHIDHFSKTQNHHHSNIVILCPTHHRLVHTANAVFDRKRKVFIYANGYEETLQLNKHL